MSQEKRRSHAWLPRKKGAPGEPFLPRVGELYLVDTRIYPGCDPAADRPVVVFSVPYDRTSRSPIRVVTRTSQPIRRGVQHPADRSLRLELDGTFSDLVSIEQQMWRPENVEFRGMLPDPYLTEVLGRFE
jgi:hypothetical protein